jgi:hypothetical protein
MIEYGVGEGEEWARAKEGKLNAMTNSLEKCLIITDYGSAICPTFLEVRIVAHIYVLQVPDDMALHVSQPEYRSFDNPLLKEP